MKLSKTQQALLDAMSHGVVVYYMPYMGGFSSTSYYFRGDTLKKCTAAVRALLRMGLVEIYRVKKEQEFRVRIVRE